MAGNYLIINALAYKREAIKNLKKLPPYQKKKAKRKIESLLSNPQLGKKLKGSFVGLRSLKSWPLRIIYSFDIGKEQITIITIDYQAGVYKRRG